MYIKIRQICQNYQVLISDVLPICEVTQRVTNSKGLSFGNTSEFLRQIISTFLEKSSIYEEPSYS